MLSSNWSIGSAKTFGKVHVIRQRIGMAPARKSRSGHKCMDTRSREALCAKLERQAVKFG